MLIQKDAVTIREMQFKDDDFDLMEKWLTDAEVLQYYEGRDHPFTRQQVIEKFGRRTIGKDSVVSCIAEYDGLPIGYMQYYELPESSKEKYGVAGARNVYGMDLFIGETRYWNQGIGIIMVKALLEYLFEVKEASKVFIDPQTWNERAIRCYEKSGFRKVKVLPQNELHEGTLRDSWLMEISAEDFQN
jgi:aminoglycoside 6'-N-acetyltransferase